jgi:hypothetical protein
MAIKANGDVSNFGIAARFIQVLLPHNLVSLFHSLVSQKLNDAGGSL